MLEIVFSSRPEAPCSEKRRLLSEYETRQAPFSACAFKDLQTSDYVKARSGAGLARRIGRSDPGAHGPASLVARDRVY